MQLSSADTVYARHASNLGNMCTVLAFADVDVVALLASICSIHLSFEIGQVWVAGILPWS